MPTNTYYIDREKTQPLEASWGWFWKNFTIRKEGQVIFELNGNKEVQAGKTVEVPNLGTLKVKLERKLGLIQELQVLLNGKPLVDSPADPYKKIRIAATLLVFVGGLNIAIGGAVVASDVKEFSDMGIGLPSIIVGAIYLLLAYLAYFRRMPSALVAAIALIVLDFAASVYFTATSGINHGGSSGLLFKLFISLYLVNGINAFKQIKEEEERGGGYRSELLDA